MLNHFANGEYPYDPAETFSAAEIDDAKRWRLLATPDRMTRKQLGRTDNCPHQPQCPNVRVCLEEIAWYLRHQKELDT